MHCGAVMHQGTRGVQTHWQHQAGSHAPTLHPQRPPRPQPLPSTWHHPERRGVACQAVRARWCLDARYGCKAEVTKLLQEWVQTIGSVAGLNKLGVNLSSGAIGCPESRLELEVTLDSVADWEAFLGRVPVKEHRAWSQRMQGMVVDGSPVWHVYRQLPLSEEPETTTSTAAAAAPGLNRLGPAPAQSSGLYLPSGMDAASGGLDALLQAEVSRAGGWPPSPASSPPGGASSPLFEPSSSVDVSGPGDDDGDIVLDWKGDPMKINKGDRMPRFL